MADPRDTDEEPSKAEPLSDSARIANLEKSLKLQRIISGAVTVIVLAMLTFFSVGYFALNGRVTANTDSATELQGGDIGADLDEKFAAYTKTLPTPDDLSDKYADKITAFNERLQGLDVYTKKSSVAELRVLMLDNEKGNQAFLFALGSGMLSLSKMVRGSRTWFQEYDAQIISAIKTSKLREKSLKRLIKAEKKRLEKTAGRR
ncbi:MAG: hypothetical protein JKX83_08815 [Pseudomonadales bacterium]|nr:hypothetical protein [Pseudomonadales bacterium]